MHEPPVMGMTTPEDSVNHRYAAASRQREDALCCPVEYNLDFLSAIPQEILERDYGCGDPTLFANAGETVLDLGSGGGKLCYILAQVVGERGKVIGVDCNREMLGLARKYQQQVADRLGFSNVVFRYGLIQDLQLDLDFLERELQQHPVHDSPSWLGLRSLEERLRRDQPLIPSASIDCVVSNCVLNLVRSQDRSQLFSEIFRVLKRGGRAAISDIVSDEDVPAHLQENPNLWSGCISGAFREDRFLAAFEEAGFHGMEIAKRQSEPWRTVEGIEFRSVTVLAYKGKQGPCWERNQGVIYRGPFKKVEDDDGHVYLRGARMAVCEKTYELLKRAPYAEQFEEVNPREAVPLADVTLFDCKRSKLRDPRESKGLDYHVTTDEVGPCCGTNEPCC